MTHDPRTTEEVYESLKDSLTGKITELTNFTDRSFNYVWTQAFAQEVRELEILATVSEFAGWIDFVGGDVTQEQLDRLGYESIDPEDVNDIMPDSYLDEYVKIVGIERFEGAEATGTVTINTQSRKTVIEEGTIVSTSPDSQGNVFEFETTEKVQTADGVTSVSDVSIEALEVGPDHNVPADTITQFDDPPIGVRGVTNPESTTGGESRESNQELRDRAKKQVEGASEGGTVEGIKAFLRQNIDAVGEGDVILEEFTESKPPFVDVIVDGGNDSDVVDAIESSRPTGMKHNLIRPQVYQIGIKADVTGSDINTSLIEEELTDYLLNLGIGEDVFRDVIIQLITNEDPDVSDIDFLDESYDRITNERFTYNQDIDSAIADDGGSFTEQTTDANDDGLDDMTLLPDAPSTGDAYYFGNDNRFAGFDINISTAGSGTWDIVWEYYNGSSWQSLSNVSDGTSDFQNSDNNIVSWDVPSDWVRTKVNEDEEYFVRARLDSFTSISEQPLGAQVRVTGSSYTLDLTYEDENGSLTLRDSDGTIYTKGTDFTVVDKSGDGWPETIRWDANQASPDHEQGFFVDYDVTTVKTAKDDSYDTDLVRDEQFTFDLNREETYSYDTNQQEYKLSFVPFDGSTSITDASGDTYAEGTDYEIISVGEEDKEETFTYSSTKDTYYLRSGADETTVDIEDDDGNSYVRGDDYTVIDTNSSGVENAIEWDTNNETPDDSDEFTVSYKADNGIPQTIDWSFGGSSPDDNENFTVTYDKKMYHLEYDLTETPKNTISDITGDTYDEDTDYEFVDYNNDSEDDSLNFLTNPSTLKNAEEFYVTYITEGDIAIDSREKADPSTNRIRVSVT